MVIDEEFGPWYAEQWPAALRLARHLLRDATAAEDVASDVLLRVWERWRVTGLPDAPEAYVARAIRNAVASVYRRRDRDRALLAKVPEVAVTADPGDAFADELTVADVLRRLPEAERTTVRLAYLQDLSTEQVARQLGVQPATVRSRLHRARRRLAAAPIPV